MRPGVSLEGALQPPRDAGPTREVEATVRRLLPSECLKLQGFSPTYLDILFRGKLAADGPKYKATGNSMAVPCMSWIGRNIQAVEDEETLLDGLVEDENPLSDLL
jgi:DNA (cytosine-5)-methyltransferase 1